MSDYPYCSTINRLHIRPFDLACLRHNEMPPCLYFLIGLDVAMFLLVDCTMMMTVPKKTNEMESFVFKSMMSSSQRWDLQGRLLYGM